jgi:hypothetical protein
MPMAGGAFARVKRPMKVPCTHSNFSGECNGRLLNAANRCGFSSTSHGLREWQETAPPRALDLPALPW